jgi:precorrin-4 methylase
MSYAIYMQISDDISYSLNAWRLKSGDKSMYVAGNKQINDSAINHP